MNSKTHKIVIADSSPIIILSKIGKLNILKGLYSEIFIPKAVFDEITSIEDIASHFVKEERWIRVLHVIDRDRMAEMPEVLHLGEKEAILLHQDLNADLLLIDDNKGREEAVKRGQTIVGLSGLLLKAKENGLITSVRPLMEAMLENNYYISEHIIKFVYSEAGELED